MNIEAFNPNKEMKEFLYSYKDEWKRVRPSQNFLENYANKINQLADKWQSYHSFMKYSVTTVRLYTDIFLADISSDLDIKNDTKYQLEWANKKQKLDGLWFRFIKDYEEELS